ncbi:MAG: glycosyltransferase family 39 protein [Planctomycetota bacterium]|nr:glycosyltransferase family 39 protein [Planctomycetota bacterium]
MIDAASTPNRSGRRPAGAAAAAGLIGLALLMWWLSGWNGGARPATVEMIWVLLTAGPWALLWLAAAFGFGWPLRSWLIRATVGGVAVQGALGAAALLLLEGAFGRVGFLQLGGSAGAWAMLVPGWVLLVTQVIRAGGGGGRSDTIPPHRLIWAAVPAVAVLLVAACSAPGWLWSSEFGGYDALSYHLQLPKEWLTAGRVHGLEHNVYSFFPSSVETAYYHLAVLIGDGVDAAYACQLLHALLTLLTAWVVADLARRRGGPIAGASAAVILLGTPWVIVVASLAYNEMVVALFLAAGLTIALDDSAGRTPVRRGIVIGLLAGAACGAKLTAIGFVAFPLGLLLLIETRPRRRLMPTALGALAAGFIPLLPWLLANGLATGNPLFPFAMSIFGTGHWTAEQAATFAGAHVTDLPLDQRLVEGWHQLMRYGIGPNPDPGEPWPPQWSILPWLALGGLVIGLLSPRLRPTTARLALVLALQIGFWLALTHIKSRFILPAVVPAALLVALVTAYLIERIPAGAARRSSIGVVFILALGYCCLPTAIFSREGGGAPAAWIGAIDLPTGDLRAALVSPRERQKLQPQHASPALWINHLLPPDAHVLCLGEATPFYYRGERITYQTTWDRGPMSRIMRESPDDPAAWIDALAREGFTHVLVNPIMLRIWEDEDWNDPLITADRIIGAAERSATLEGRFPNGVLLYRLPPPGGG